MAMHNAAPYLRECVGSILTQTFADFELLIVDDGSTDDSTDIIRSYSDPRIRLIRRHHDFIPSLNTLLDEARGQYRGCACFNTPSSMMDYTDLE